MFNMRYHVSNKYTTPSVLVLCAPTAWARSQYIASSRYTSATAEAVLCTAAAERRSNAAPAT